MRWRTCWPDCWITWKGPKILVKMALVDQLGEGLTQTTTKRIAWRMLLVAVALLLRNLWVWRNQQTLRGHVSLSLQLHQLNSYLSRELELILDFEISKSTKRKRRSTKPLRRWNY